jgi:hypothetical protein
MLAICNYHITLTNKGAMLLEFGRYLFNYAFRKFCEYDLINIFFSKQQCNVWLVT